jgi:PEGA domain
MSKTFLRAVSAIMVFGIMLTGQSFAQSGAVIPQGGAGHAQQASCVILKRMGPADQVTSRLYSFGIRGKQFQYVEGKLPDGFPFHGRLTDHDVRNLQGRGAEVIVLNQNYTSEELGQARADCRGETGTTPNQAEAKAAQSSAPLRTPTPSAPASPSSTANTVAGPTTELDISSTPSGADIEVDGKFVGNTPSSVTVAPGDHDIAVKKSGFAVWDRNVSISGGHINISAELTPQTK